MAVWRLIRTRTLQNLSWVLILVFLMGNVFLPVASYIQGHFYPVVSHLQVRDITPFTRDGQEYSLLRGTADKYRDCSFSKVDWFLGSRTGPSVPLTMYFLDPPVLNKVGPLQWEGIVVGATPGQVLTATFANVLHYCPLFGTSIRVPVVAPYFDVGLSTGGAVLREGPPLVATSRPTDKR